MGDKTGDDRRMFVEEWVKGYKNVGNHGFVGLKEAAGLDPKAAEGLFKEMNSGRDADGKEYGKDNCVMLAEFCAWVEQKEVAAGTLSTKSREPNRSPLAIATKKKHIGFRS